jgi:hypothetical protein
MQRVGEPPALARLSAAPHALTSFRVSDLGGVVRGWRSARRSRAKVAELASDAVGADR